jgi:hypothetical protein
MVAALYAAVEVVPEVVAPKFKVEVEEDGW